MGGGNDELKGPDLATEGVASSDLEEGGTRPGHADGEAVMLVRIDGQVVAVAAKCTHYGGPLPEGVIENGRVHCPWHHACFDLRTGEAVQPPALASSEIFKANKRCRIGFYSIVFPGTFDQDLFHQLNIRSISHSHFHNEPGNILVR
jgi:nitrite reductase/ring-hydroxylating ferredoxin subunit